MSHSLIEWDHIVLTPARAHGIGPYAGLPPHTIFGGRARRTERATKRWTARWGWEKCTPASARGRRWFSVRWNAGYACASCCCNTLDVMLRSRGFVCAFNLCHDCCPLYSTIMPHDVSFNLFWRLRSASQIYNWKNVRGRLPPIYAHTRYFAHTHSFTHRNEHGRRATVLL